LFSFFYFYCLFNICLRYMWTLVLHLHQDLLKRMLFFFVLIMYVITFFYCDYRFLINLVSIFSQCFVF
jgi:hypothetical protein